MDNNVALVSELCVEINNKIGDLKRRELAKFKEQFAETSGALRCAWPTAATAKSLGDWLNLSTSCTPNLEENGSNTNFCKFFYFSGHIRHVTYRRDRNEF